VRFFDISCKDGWKFVYSERQVDEWVYNNKGINGSAGFFILYLSQTTKKSLLLIINVMNNRTNISEYERVARQVKMAFEKEFGKLSLTDFNRVAGIIGYTSARDADKSDEYYRQLSDDEKKAFDFMMML
jgi:hypothetical protein